LCVDPAVRAVACSGRVCALFVFVFVFVFMCYITKLSELHLYVQSLMRSWAEREGGEVLKVGSRQ